MNEAARLGDAIEHRHELAGMLLGLAAGALIGAACVATGGAAIVIAGAAIAGASAGAGVGENLGSWSWTAHSVGEIKDNCSENVFINGQPVALLDSLANCDNHRVPASIVAQGSTNVFINGRPVARKGDRLSCSARIMEGSSNVFIGGGTASYRDINPIIPNWLNYTMMGLGAVGALMSGIGLPAVILGGIAGGIGSIGSGYLAAKEWGEGSDEALAAELAGGFIGGLLGMQAGKSVGMLIVPEEVPTTPTRAFIRNGVPGTLDAIRAQKAEAAKAKALQDAIAEIEQTLLDEDGNIRINPELQKHLSTVDGYTQKTGIKGAHNEEVFLAEVDRIGGEIEGSPEVLGHPAIKLYRYRQPTLNAKDDVVGLKSLPKKKTTYDPNIISDEEMVIVADRAVQSNKENIIKNASEGRTQYNIFDEDTGIEFHAYLDKMSKSFLRNVHPK